MSREEAIQWLREAFQSSDIEFVAFTLDRQTDQWTIIRRTRPPTMMTWEPDDSRRKR